MSVGGGDGAHHSRNQQGRKRQSQNEGLNAVFRTHGIFRGSRLQHRRLATFLQTMGPTRHKMPRQPAVITIAPMTHSTAPMAPVGKRAKPGLQSLLMSEQKSPETASESPPGCPLSLCDISVSLSGWLWSERRFLGVYRGGRDEQA